MSRSTQRIILKIISDFIVHKPHVLKKKRREWRSSKIGGFEKSVTYVWTAPKDSEAIGLPYSNKQLIFAI